jgi:hypothetical protein
MKPYLRYTILHSFHTRNSMGLFARIVQRLFIFLVAIIALWLIVTQIFNRLDQQLPLFVALLLTYVFSAYLVLPQIIHFSLMVLRRGRIPRVTHAADGLLADPVNIVLMGSFEDLAAAFMDGGRVASGRPLEYPQQLEDGHQLPL